MTESERTRTDQTNVSQRSSLLPYPAGIFNGSDTFPIENVAVALQARLGEGLTMELFFFSILSIFFLNYSFILVAPSKY